MDSLSRTLFPKVQERQRGFTKRYNVIYSLFFRSGLINMKVSKVHDACRFSVRLVEHISDDTRKKWPSQYLEVAGLMSDYFLCKT